MSVSFLLVQNSSAVLLEFAAGSDDWHFIFSLSVIPISLASVVSLLSSVWLQRWLVVARDVRKVTSTRIETYAKATILYPKLIAILDILELEATAGIRRLRLIRFALICFMLALMFLLFAAFGYGLNIFTGTFDFIVRIVLIVGLLLVVFGVSFAFRELLEPVHPEQRTLSILLQIEKDPPNISQMTPDKQTEHFDALVHKCYPKSLLKARKKEMKSRGETL